jgi:hypothetical protein
MRSNSCHNHTFVDCHALATARYYCYDKKKSPRDLSGLQCYDGHAISSLIFFGVGLSLLHCYEPATYLWRSLTSALYMLHHAACLEPMLIAFYFLTALASLELQLYPG